VLGGNQPHLAAHQPVAPDSHTLIFVPSGFGARFAPTCG
jgi:hypothetical protein